MVSLQDTHFYCVLQRHKTFFGLDSCSQSFFEPVRDCTMNIGCLLPILSISSRYVSGTLREPILCEENKTPAHTGIQLSTNFENVLPPDFKSVCTYVWVTLCVTPVIFASFAFTRSPADVFHGSHAFWLCV